MSRRADEGCGRQRNTENASDFTWWFFFIIVLLFFFFFFLVCCFVIFPEHCTEKNNENKACEDELNTVAVFLSREKVDDQGGHLVSPGGQLCPGGGHNDNNGRRGLTLGSEFLDKLMEMGGWMGGGVEGGGMGMGKATNFWQKKKEEEEEEEEEEEKAKSKVKKKW